MYIDKFFSVLLEILYNFHYIDCPPPRVKTRVSYIQRMPEKARVSDSEQLQGKRP